MIADYRIASNTMDSMWECPICGVVVTNIPLHDKWHEQLNHRIGAAARTGRDSRLNIIG